MRDLLLSVAVLLLLLGCSGALPQVKPPQIDAMAAAQGALAEFDQDGDGQLSKEEACQGMTQSWDRYDTDEDDLISQDELAARFTDWTDGDTGMMNMRANVTFKGKPLPDATVELTPYAFLGENLKPCGGKTDRYGGVFLSIPKDRLPESQQQTFGIQVGLYQVRISHDSAKLPAKYNDETELSVDVAPVDSNNGLTFKL